MLVRFPLSLVRRALKNTKKGVPACLDLEVPAIVIGAYRVPGDKVITPGKGDEKEGVMTREQLASFLEKYAYKKRFMYAQTKRTRVVLSFIKPSKR